MTTDLSITTIAHELLQFNSNLITKLGGKWCTISGTINVSDLTLSIDDFEKKYLLQISDLLQKAIAKDKTKDKAIRNGIKKFFPAGCLTAYTAFNRPTGIRNCVKATLNGSILTVSFFNQSHGLENVKVVLE